MKRRNILDIIEKAALKLVYILLGILIMVQGLYYIPNMGSYLNAAIKMEGEPLNTRDMLQYASGITATPWATISLQLRENLSIPEVKVFIDGKEVGNFLHKELTFKVKHGDIIMVQNPHTQLPVTVFIAKKTPNITLPLLHSQVQGTGRMYFDPIVIR